jgi:hypothetical protein
MKNPIPLTFALLAAAAISGAQTFDFSQIVNWTGTGSNEAAMLIDWSDGSTNPALVWGYRWDGDATGEQMMQAIMAADPDLTVQIINDPEFGDYVNGIGFDGAGGVGSHFESGFEDGNYWGYFLGSGTSYPAWNYSEVGFTDRTLTNDSWDGWEWSSGAPPSDQPIAAPLSTPEPVSLVGLLLVPVALLRKRN